MMCVALHMRPWVKQMEHLKMIATILGDDVIFIAKGEDMLIVLPNALEIIHELLHDMGAKVAPHK